MFDGARPRRSGAEDAADRACQTMLHPQAALAVASGPERFDFAGAEVFLFTAAGDRYRLRLRDLSCIGLGGLTDAALSMGERVFVQLEEMLMPAADVGWTAGAMAGFKLVDPLPLTHLRRLCERHQAGAAWSPAMRAGSDLYSWWTDLAEQERGRQTRLHSGGHEHPLAR